MSKSRSLARQCLALATVLWSAAGYADEAMTVSGAWVREAPSHAEVSAAYLTIHNPSTQTHTLTGVGSPQFQRAEIHSTRMINGQMHMQKLAEVAVAAQGTLEFKPGEYHIMLIQPLHPLKTGDIIEMTLQFKDGTHIAVQAPIRNSEEKDSEPHHHDMGDMKM